MTVSEVQEKILKIKRETNTCILAHIYQSQPILEIADFVGDSFGLSVQAAKTSADNIVMCGVRFMAETCKILNPDKRVYLVNPFAGCPMADQLDPEFLARLKEKYPGYAVVAYINTSAELKAHCDICVTSSSAVQICKAIPEQKILFVPDQHLGKYTAKQVPEKTFAFFPGGCPRHFAVTEADVQRMKALYPDALLLVHPECREEVSDAADFVGSTTEIMDYAGKSDANEFIIGTEVSIVEHLQYKHPEKKFYPLSVNLTCSNMRVTTLTDVLNCLTGKDVEEIVLPDETMKGAFKCIRRMIEIGK